MAMFLTILFASFAVLAICSIMFAGLEPKADRSIEVRPEPTVRIPAPQFFAGDMAIPVGLSKGRAHLPIEVLLSQIENHVRLEQAAAESFLSLPATDRLHSRSASTLLH